MSQLELFAAANHPTAFDNSKLCSRCGENLNARAVRAGIRRCRFCEEELALGLSVGGRAKGAPWAVDALRDVA